MFDDFAIIVFRCIFMPLTPLRLSCFGIDDMWFALMYSFGDVGPFLSGFSMFAIILYFVTSSDSGSLIIDIISANGDQVSDGDGKVDWYLVVVSLFVQIWEIER